MYDKGRLTVRGKVFGGSHDFNGHADDGSSRRLVIGVYRTLYRGVWSPVETLSLIYML